MLTDTRHSNTFYSIIALECNHSDVINGRRSREDVKWNVLKNIAISIGQLWHLELITKLGDLS
jgi:hypothetical protein